MIQRIKDLIFYFLIPFWQLLDLLIPKDRSILIFLLQTDTFRADIHTFFHYCRQKPGFQPYLMVKQNKTYLQLQKQYPGRVLQIYRPRHLFTFLRSKYVFASHYRHLKPLYVPHGTKIVIGLQHGVTALKKGYYLQNPGRFYIRPYDYVIASSEFQKWLVAENMRIEESRIWVTGFPRLDDLRRPDDRFLIDFREINNKKLILYAPTFQDPVQVELFPFPDFSPDTLKDKLKEVNAVLFIKFHPNTDELSLLARENLGHILTPNLIYHIDSAGVRDLNRILQYTDLLITDYSSIFFDYLFFNKPVVFLPGDQRSFQEQRGFIIDYMENTPGPKINRFDRFLKAVESGLKHPETGENMRTAIREKFFKYGTSGNCDRVWDHFIRLGGGA